jgi:hypothetical protein
LAARGTAVFLGRAVVFLTVVFAACLVLRGGMYVLCHTGAEDGKVIADSPRQDSDVGAAAVLDRRYSPVGGARRC